MTTIQGPAVFLAQFIGDEAPFNSLDGICKWAADLGFKGIQMPTLDTRFIDLQKAAESKTYADELKAKFVDGGVKTFGSGWIWLCADNAGKLSLVSTSNAAVPFTNNGPTPLLVADVWEHAYYVDYRNARLKYLETFWSHINWNFVSENFKSKKVKELTSSMV